LLLTIVSASSIAITAKNIFLTHGIAGFYPGVIPYLVADGLSGAVKFATFEIAKKNLEERLPSKYHPYLQFVCGAIAMITCSFLLVPGEVIKTNLQAGSVNIIINVTNKIFFSQ
jgi:hypothetical protein